MIRRGAFRPTQLESELGQLRRFWGPARTRSVDTHCTTWSPALAVAVRSCPQAEARVG